MPAAKTPATSWDAIIKAAAEEANTTPERARAVYRAIAASIAATLRKNNDYPIDNWGTFAVARRAARNGTNPRTHAHIKIASKKVARFRLTPHLRHRIVTMGIV